MFNVIAFNWGFLMGMLTMIVISIMLAWFNQNSTGSGDGGTPG